MQDPLRDEMKELAMMNISWKFEEVILNNNKDMSVRTYVYNAFLNMTS